MKSQVRNSTKQKPQTRQKPKRAQPPVRRGTKQSTSFAAAAYASGQKVREPQIRGGGKSTRIVHRELIANINGSTSDFSLNQSLDINPGLATSFPWLSTQASGWEQYRFHQLKFELMTRAPTTATGGVYLAPDYDVLDASPDSELTISTYRDAVEDAPWKDQVCVLDPSAMFPLGPRKYVRDGLVANSDLKTYDACKMYVATGGQADASAVGKLWVAYDVEFFVPQTNSAANPLPRDFAQFQLNSTQGLVTGVSETVAFDGNIINSLGIVNNGGTFSLPKGNYLVSCDVCVNGGTSTTQNVNLDILKNGAALSPNCINSAGQNGANATALHIERFVFSNGSDTVRADVSYASAAGTLSLVATGSRISFQTL